MGTWKKRVQLPEDELICDSCDESICSVVLDYTLKGIWQGPILFGRIVSREYYLVCNTCKQEWPLPPKERYLAYEKQLIPWTERQGSQLIAIYFLSALGFIAGMFVVAFIDFMLSAG
ncbi:MAG: hypothetical protein FWG78_01320 [Coriobacteriia bacterium]|nr:hypothetical protein [Coriobacteriia bacterium]